MRCFVRKLLLLSVALSPLALVGSVQGASWIFLPSYYSHDPVTPVQVGPRYQGGPYYVRPRGEFVRSGYSHTQTVISVGNQGTDCNNYYESWIQVGGQY